MTYTLVCVTMQPTHACATTSITENTILCVEGEDNSMLDFIEKWRLEIALLASNREPNIQSDIVVTNKHIVWKYYDDLSAYVDNVDKKCYKIKCFLCNRIDYGMMCAGDDGCGCCKQVESGSGYYSFVKLLESRKEVMIVQKFQWDTSVHEDCVFLLKILHEHGIANSKLSWGNVVFAIVTLLSTILRAKPVERLTCV